MADMMTMERISIDHLVLSKEVEDFLYYESELLDGREFEQWVELFTDDTRYWMPIRKNLPFNRRFNDMTGDNETAWFDDDKPTLRARVAQIMTGVHWAEEPLSRVTHLITNIRVDRDAAAEGGDIPVHSNFLVHRNRMETETNFMVGRRQDLLRRTDKGFRIARRKIIIDQSILLAKNLSFFI